MKPNVTNGFVTIEYNEEFDREHYPVEEMPKSYWETLKTLSREYRLSREWTVFATIHGLVFQASPKNPAIYSNRLDQVRIDLINEIENFRWIEVGQSKLAIALQHFQKG